MQRLFTNLCVKNIQLLKQFYVTLFGLNVDFESPWFIHMTDPLNPFLELGLIDEKHEIVPAAIRESQNLASSYLTFVVEDVELIYDKAVNAGFSVKEVPKVMFYGQKRMILEDPEGRVLDVSSIFFED